ncbi:hypothetical protein GCM10027405_32060 [Arthrobacter alkaliphilus]|uniref:lycopene cyclase domain-containing protein n=1 Tax=Arthrobacter alkaliphilus TaxID=369936 RepID=UPI001F2AB1BA|nr:lycopene cyclase domain-containing protein [Arthrobacter alkaliphilus]
MTYLLLDLGFLVLAAAATLASALMMRRRAGKGLAAWPSRRTLAAGLLVFGVLCVLTAGFDNLMIAAGLFAYSAEHTSGWRIGLAPVEDFAYVLGAAVLLPALWMLLTAGKEPDRD